MSDVKDLPTIRREAGLCVRCGLKTWKGGIRCRTHTIEHADRQREYYHAKRRAASAPRAA